MIKINNLDISNDTLLRKKEIRNAISVIETGLICENIYQLIESFLDEKESVILYEAIGKPDNIENIIEMHKDSKYIYEENDKDKFFIRNYPRLILNISNRYELKQVIDEWNCTIYESRNIFIINNNVCVDLKDMIKLGSRDILSKNDVKCMICNEPESSYHNTFILYYVDDMRKSIIKFLKDVEDDKT